MNQKKVWAALSRLTMRPPAKPLSVSLVASLEPSSRGGIFGIKKKKEKKWHLLYQKKKKKMAFLSFHPLTPRHFHYHLESQLLRASPLSPHFQGKPIVFLWSDQSPLHLHLLPSLLEAHWRFLTYASPFMREGYRLPLGQPGSSTFISSLHVGSPPDLHFWHCHRWHLQPP